MSYDDIRSMKTVGMDLSLLFVARSMTAMIRPLMSSKIICD